MNERREFVRLRCPLCDWSSLAENVRDEPNPLWQAQHRLGRSYRQHFDTTHRPAPVAMHGFYSKEAP